jgi:exopolysaccharide biosynthesis WecB/TagA/CpsF family protein
VHVLKSGNALDAAKASYFGTLCFQIAYDVAAAGMLGSWLTFNATPERMEFQFDTHAIRVTLPDSTALLALVRARLAARQGFALATINLDHLVKLNNSEAFRQAYAAQDMVVADGNPVVWLSRLARRPVALVPGSDMVLPLAQAAALVGSSGAVLAAAADSLRTSVPGLRITMQVAPAMGFDPEGAEAAHILQALAQADIGLCFIALGAPKQETFAARGRSLAPQVGFASVGAGLDFIAGHQTRAPEWWRRFALEWLWRTVSSPRRLLPRYAACAAILPGQVLAALRLRRQPSGQA